MNIPLIATINHRTIDLRTKALKVKIYRNSETEATISPYTPYYYIENKEGSEYRTIASDKTVKLSKHTYLPMRDTVPPQALYDGGREALLERLLIEHPDFFAAYPNTDNVKCLVFDIETHSPDGSFPFGEKYPVVAIGIITSTGEREVLLWDGEDDRNVILKFAEYINDYDPDIVCGYNLVGYDIPQILHRARYHGLKGYKKILNRDNSNWGWDVGKHQKDLKMNAGGRIILDLLRWTRLDYSLSGTPRGLKSVSRSFGLEPLELDFGKKDLLDYNMEEIHEYVLSDVDCTMYLYNHYFPQIQYVAETLCVPLATYVNAPASYITKILQGRSLFEQGMVTLDRNKERHPEIYKADKGNYQAAHIELYQPGFHKRNVKVDFSAFYPSISMMLNLGPDTTQIIGYDDYDEKLEEKDGILYIPDKNVGKRIMVRVDNSKKSCLYNMCAEFKEMRKPYKLGTTKRDKSRSDALKIMVNTFYGANANPYISYGDMGVSITITSVARWLLLAAVSIIKGRYGEDSVVYVHTDGINCNVDVDDTWLVNRLRILLKHTFTNCEPEHIAMDKDYFREGVWLQIGNYVLRNEDGSLTKHGSTFKSTNRSKFYLKVLDRLIEARINNTINQKFIDSLYDLQEYEIPDFIMRKSMGRAKDAYKTETDVILSLIRQGEEIGMTPAEGTTFYYIKTNDGYKLESMVTDIEDVDITYHWDIISTLLHKFTLHEWIKKAPPLTLLDKKQQSLMEWI